jgi:hypothetical protein
MTKQIKFTPAQVQNFIFLLEGEDAPILLQNFYEENSDKVFEKKTNWVIDLNCTAINFLIKEMKSYIVFLEKEIVNFKTKKDSSTDYPIYNRARINVAKRIIQKLS